MKLYKTQGEIDKDKTIKRMKRWDVVHSMILAVIFF
jgi:hypothetical protein